LSEKKAASGRFFREPFFLPVIGKSRGIFPQKICFGKNFGTIIIVFFFETVYNKAVVKEDCFNKIYLEKFFRRFRNEKNLYAVIAVDFSHDPYGGSGTERAGGYKRYCQ
jgi:hypothetical protein